MVSVNGFATEVDLSRSYGTHGECAIRCASRGSENRTVPSSSKIFLLSVSREYQDIGVCPDIPRGFQDVRMLRY